ncbi:carboxyl transferase domain-containing protein [Bacillus sp. SL00103]
MVTGFARLQGDSIGVVANQPKVLAGGLDLDAADKAGQVYSIFAMRFTFRF